MWKALRVVVYAVVLLAIVRWGYHKYYVPSQTEAFVAGRTVGAVEGTCDQVVGMHFLIVDNGGSFLEQEWFAHSRHPFRFRLTSAIDEAISAKWLESLRGDAPPDPTPRPFGPLNFGGFTAATMAQMYYDYIDGFAFASDSSEVRFVKDEMGNIFGSYERKSDGDALFGGDAERLLHQTGKEGDAAYASLKRVSNALLGPWGWDDKGEWWLDLVDACDDYRYQLFHLIDSYPHYP